MAPRNSGVGYRIGLLVVPVRASQQINNRGATYTAVTGTTPYTACHAFVDVTFVPSECYPYRYRYHVGQPPLLNRHYASAVLLVSARSHPSHVPKRRTPITGDHS